MRVLYLDLDTLRPDHLGCYGYHRDTSPNIDKIAKEGSLFENFYCSDAPCLPSRSALMSGQFGIHNGAVNHGGTAADMFLEGEDRDFRTRHSHFCLPNIFRREGMHTCSISPFAERHSTYTFLAGFNEMHNTGKGGCESAEEVTPVVLKWIEDKGSDDDWFLHVNYWDPHTPYRAPADFDNPFKNQPAPAWITQEVFEEHLKHVGPHSAHEISMYNDSTTPKWPRQPGKLSSLDDVKNIMDQYDCGIAYMDQHIGMIVEALEKQGVLDDTVIIISADHSENMGELGLYAEHATADYGTCRIPMIIRWPGGAENERIKGLLYNIDLAPTLADLLNQKREPEWDGMSFAPSILKGEETTHPYLVLSQCAHVCQRSVRKGPWLYMRTYHDGFHLFPKEMLFNIEEDPYEQRDIAADHPEICAECAADLLDWHDEMMMTSPHAVDPMWTVIREGGPLHAKGKLKEYCKRLEATGRGNAIPELKRRHPQEF